MTDSERITLELLKAGIWGTDPGGIGCADWKGVIRTARKLSVLPIVADRIMKIRPAGLDAKDGAVLSDAILDALYTSDRVSSTLVEVFRRLEEAGMKPVLLKGHSNAVNYPDPYLRACGDIDVYVGAERYEEAGLMFGEEEDPILKTKHTHGNLNGIPLEFHRTSAKMRTSRMNRIYQEHERKYLEGGHGSITVQGRRIPVPDPTFNLFFLVYHAWEHLMECGTGIKQMCDICLFIDRHREELDTERLKGMIKETGMALPWRTFMSVCTDVLGLDPKKAPFRGRTPKWKIRYLMSIMFKEGYFGHYGRRVYGNSWAARKSRAIVIFTGRYIKLVPLFPLDALRGYARFMTYQFFWQLFGMNVFPPEETKKI